MWGPAENARSFPVYHTPLREPVHHKLLHVYIMGNTCWHLTAALQLIDLHFRLAATACNNRDKPYYECPWHTRAHAFENRKHGWNRIFPFRPVRQPVCTRAPLLPRCAENVYGSSCATLRTYDRTAILLQREGFDPPSILSLLALFC